MRQGIFVIRATQNKQNGKIANIYELIKKQHIGNEYRNRIPAETCPTCNAAGALAHLEPCDSFCN